jgi:threonylcarbamoyladenosine tRNA methylthiotransferase MtaB
VRRATLVTFGCKVNQYESQALREELRRDGYTLVAEGEPADLHVVNTCTVTETAAQEALRWVRRVGRRHPAGRIRVVGCAAKTHGAEFARLPGVEAVLPHDPGRLAGDSISDFEGRTRAFVKIQDGCDLNCSFCIIPTVRGPGRQRPAGPIVEEVRRLVERGFAEIVLTGVHLGGYRGLAGLLERLLQVSALARIRLSSLEANEVGDGLLELMAAAPDRLCPHLHLPLQSGDDAILGRMRRRYNAGMFERTVERVAARVPDPAFSTDVIVGFPGEDESSFERTLSLCRRVGFMRIHAFPYSPRGGTDAAAWAQTVSAADKKRRVHALKRLAQEQARAFAARFVGRRVDVLVESDQEGYTERYLPARVPGGRPGQLVRRRAAGADDGVLTLEA